MATDAPCKRKLSLNWYSVGISKFRKETGAHSGNSVIESPTYLLCKGSLRSPNSRKSTNGLARAVTTPILEPDGLEPRQQTLSAKFTTLALI